MRHWLSRVIPGDSAGFAVFTFPQVPAGTANLLKYVQRWVERIKDLALLLQRDNVAGTTQTPGNRRKSRQRYSTARWLGIMFDASCPVWRHRVVGHLLLHNFRPVAADPSLFLVLER